MASIEKRGRSYRIVFRFDGRKFGRSLKTKCERDAKASLVRLEDNLCRVELGTLVVPEATDVATFLLSDGQKKAKRQRSAIRTLSHILDAFFVSLPDGSLEESTLYGMGIHQKHLLRLLGLNLRIHALQFDDLQSYVDKRSKEPGLRGRTVSPATIKKELRTLSTVWTWALETGIVNSPLAKRRLRFSKTTEKPRFQTWQEIDRVIQRRDLTADQEADLWGCLFVTREEIDELLLHVRQHARHPFIYPMFVFASHTGARRSEMMRSQVDDIDLYAGTVTIREKKRARGTLTTRSVPISPELAGVLEPWLDRHPGGDYTFCHHAFVARSGKHHRHGEPLTKNETVDHFRRTLAGSKWGKLRGWHVFRHSFCSNCAAAGVDQRLINGWVGHQTEDMVRRYRHLIPNQQQAEIQRVFGSVASQLKIIDQSVETLGRA